MKDLSLCFLLLLSPLEAHGCLGLCSVDHMGSTPITSLFLKFIYLFMATPRSTQNFPNQGSNPCPLHWKRGVLTTGPPGKSTNHFFSVRVSTSSEVGKGLLNLMKEGSLPTGTEAVRECPRCLCIRHSFSEEAAHGQHHGIICPTE